MQIVYADSFSVAGLGVESDHGLSALWSDIEGRREVRVIEHVRVVRLHPLCDALLVCSSAVTTAHRSGIISLVLEDAEFGCLTAHLHKTSVGVELDNTFSSFQVP
jgi:hypothetical protein